MKIILSQQKKSVRMEVVQLRNLPMHEKGKLDQLPSLWQVIVNEVELRGSSKENPGLHV